MAGNGRVKRWRRVSGGVVVVVEHDERVGLIIGERPIWSCLFRPCTHPSPISLSSSSPLSVFVSATFPTLQILVFSNIIHLCLQFMSKCPCVVFRRARPLPQAYFSESDPLIFRFE